MPFVALRVDKTLLYSNLFASILILSLIDIASPFAAFIMFPFSIISISAVLKMNSFPDAKFLRDKKIKIKNK